MLRADAEADRAVGIPAQARPRGDDVGGDRDLLLADARRSPSPRSSRRAWTRFIGGLPMKLATNRFTGRSNTDCGSPVCWSTPPRITATRSPIVIASTWSCVT